MPPVRSRERSSAVRYASLNAAQQSPILAKPNKVAVFAPADVPLSPSSSLADGLVMVVGGIQGWRKKMEDTYVMRAFSLPPASEVAAQTTTMAPRVRTLHFAASGGKADAHPAAPVSGGAALAREGDPATCPSQRGADRLDASFPEHPASPADCGVAAETSVVSLRSPCVFQLPHCVQDVSSTGFAAHAGETESRTAQVDDAAPTAAVPARFSYERLRNSESSQPQHSDPHSPIESLLALRRVSLQRNSGTEAELASEWDPVVVAGPMGAEGSTPALASLTGAEVSVTSPLPLPKAEGNGVPDELLTPRRRPQSSVSVGDDVPPLMRRCTMAVGGNTIVATPEPTPPPLSTNTLQLETLSPGVSSTSSPMPPASRNGALQVPTSSTSCNSVVVALFDGHRGDQAALFLAEHLPMAIERHLRTLIACNGAQNLGGDPLVESATPEAKYRTPTVGMCTALSGGHRAVELFSGWPFRLRWMALRGAFREVDEALLRHQVAQAAEQASSLPSSPSGSTDALVSELPPADDASAFLGSRGKVGSALVKSGEFTTASRKQLSRSPTSVKILDAAPGAVDAASRQTAAGSLSSSLGMVSPRPASSRASHSPHREAASDCGPRPMVRVELRVESPSKTLLAHHGCGLGHLITAESWGAAGSPDSDVLLGTRQRLLSRSKLLPPSNSPGATAIVFVIEDEFYSCASLGDCRAYLAELRVRSPMGASSSLDTTMLAMSLTEGTLVESASIPAATSESNSEHSKQLLGQGKPVGRQRPTALTSVNSSPRSVREPPMASPVNPTPCDEPFGVLSSYMGDTVKNEDSSTASFRALLRGSGLSASFPFPESQGGSTSSLGTGQGLPLPRQTVDLTSQTSVTSVGSEGVASSRAAAGGKLHAKLPHGMAITSMNDVHRTTNDTERRRLELQFGPQVLQDGRVLGKLSVTRSFGDFDMKFGSSGISPSQSERALAYMEGVLLGSQSESPPLSPSPWAATWAASCDRQIASSATNIAHSRSESERTPPASHNSAPILTQIRARYLFGNGARADGSPPRGGCEPRLSDTVPAPQGFSGLSPAASAHFHAELPELLISPVPEVRVWRRALLPPRMADSNQKGASDGAAVSSTTSANAPQLLAEVHAVKRDNVPVGSYDLLVAGTDGVWELLTIDDVVARAHAIVEPLFRRRLALLTDVARPQPGATADSGMYAPEDANSRAPFAPPSSMTTWQQEMVKELEGAVQALLSHGCAQRCDPRGTTLGGDNMSLAVTVILAE